jgi:hypothetical protein
MPTWGGWKQAWTSLHDEQADYLEQIPQQRVQGAVLLASA